MAFTIPNAATAGNPNQAEVDTVDLAILVQGIAGDGITCGAAATAQVCPDLTVAVASGKVRIGGTEACISSGNVTIGAANACNPRFDLITVDACGTKAVTAGTAAGEPIFPSVPACSVAIAAVYIPAGDTTISSGQIIDKRVNPVGASSGVDHGGLSGLGDDDHTQYALLAGRACGQCLIGGTGAGDNLMLSSTSNATKGAIVFGQLSRYCHANARLGIGTGSCTTVEAKLQVKVGDSGATVCPNGFVIEHCCNANISLLTPNTKAGIIYFGDPENATRGAISYCHANDRLQLQSQGFTQAWWTDGSFVFQRCSEIASAACSNNHVTLRADGTGVVRVNDSLRVLGYVGAVGSLCAPANTTDGDITATRLFSTGNTQVGVDGSAGKLILSAVDACNEGGELQINGAGCNTDWTVDNSGGSLRFITGACVQATLGSGGQLRLSGYLRVGSQCAPCNTTAGDLTSQRSFNIGNAVIGSQTASDHRLQVSLTTASDAPTAQTICYTLNNACCAVGIPTAWRLNAVCAATANRTSAQLLRFVFTKNGGATAVAAAFDSLAVFTPVINEDLSSSLRGITLEGPTVMACKTLGSWTGLQIDAPAGCGTTTTSIGVNIGATTFAFKLPACGCAVGCAAGRIPICIGGATRYLQYFA